MCEGLAELLDFRRGSSQEEDELNIIKNKLDSVLAVLSLICLANAKSLPKRCLFRCKVTKKSFTTGYFDAKIITISITIRLSSEFLFSNYTSHNNKISI